MRNIYLFACVQIVYFNWDQFLIRLMVRCLTLLYVRQDNDHPDDNGDRMLHERVRERESNGCFCMYNTIVITSCQFDVYMSFGRGILSIFWRILFTLFCSVVGIRLITNDCDKEFVWFHEMGKNQTNLINYLVWYPSKWGYELWMKSVRVGMVVSNDFEAFVSG